MRRNGSDPAKYALLRRISGFMTAGGGRGNASTSRLPGTVNIVAISSICSISPNETDDPDMYDRGSDAPSPRTWLIAVDVIDEVDPYELGRVLAGLGAGISGVRAGEGSAVYGLVAPSGE